MDIIYASLMLGLVLGLASSHTHIGGQVKRVTDEALMSVVYALVFLVGASSGRTLVDLASKGDPWLAVHVLSYMLLPGLAGAGFALIFSRVAGRWTIRGRR